MNEKKNIHDEAKAPDAFITSSQHVLHFIERHAKLVGALAGTALVVGTGYTSYTYLTNRSEAKAAEAIYKFEAELRQQETKIREERAKKMGDLAAALKDKKSPPVMPEFARPVDYAKDYAPLVAKVKAEIQAQNSTRAAVLSALGLANFLLQQKQFGEALEILRIPSHQPGTTDVMGGIWRMNLGLALIENQKFDEAIKVYDEVVAANSLKAFRPEALLKLGMAQELKGDVTTAKQTYQKLGREFPNSDASHAANQFMRLMEIKEKQG